MRVLHLTLKKKWFDMIASGNKKDEYRYLSHFFCSRFLVDFHWPRSRGKYTNPELDEIASYEFKTWDYVTFTNGYSRDSRKITLKFEGLEISSGLPEWGAVPNKLYFVIKLGNQIV